MSARDSLTAPGPRPRLIPTLTLFACALAGLLLLARPASAAEGPLVSTYLSDGKAITVEQFLPGGAGRHPTLLTRTPYDKNRPGDVETATWFAARG